MGRTDRATAAGWEAQTEEPVAHFVSDALLERLRSGFEAQAAQGIRETARGVAVRRVGIAQLRTRGRFDALSVAVDLDGLLVVVSRKDGRELGTRPIEAAGLGGFWTLVRRRGAKTRGSSGLIEGVCPNCASPVPQDGNAHCRACGSVLKGGLHDWVLCEITATRHWKVLPASRAPGMVAYGRHDPGFSVQHLEDRAAVLFWRMEQAERSGEVEPLRGGATPELCERYAARLAQPRLEGRDAVRLLAVEARGVLRGEVLDTAAVEIRWSIEPADSAGAAAVRPHESLFELVRRAGVTSPEGHDLTSAHCPACGAPDDRRGGTTCSFCGVTLNDGSQDWVLAGLHESLSREADALLGRIRAQ